MQNNFTFDLPADLIAQEPPVRRGDSRLLLVAPGGGARGEIVFRDLPLVLRAGDRLVLNESRVLPARLQTRRQDTGGQVEILLLRPVGDNRWPGGWTCMARPARRLRSGIRLAVEAPPGGVVGEAPCVTVLYKDDDTGQVVVGCDADLAEVAEAWGVMPLPPYIKRSDENAGQDSHDRDRYQTVYAETDASGAGSVAAPTAGLHFSAETLRNLETAGVGLSRVSLHVGLGTFKPPSDEQIQARRLHQEFFRLPAQTGREIAATRAAGGRVIAVGTTALRVLESVHRLGLDEEGPDVRAFGRSESTPDPFFSGEARRLEGHWEVAGETRLFISPPDRIKAADGLLTNFHLPESSLLMLVASLMGENIWHQVYHEAVQTRMRFYSYGDCMLILPGVASSDAASGVEKP